MSETLNVAPHDVTIDPPMMIGPANPLANVSIMRSGSLAHRGEKV